MHKNLNEPIRVGALQLKNRLVFPSVRTELAEEGIVTEEMGDYYRRILSSGRIGLLITEPAYVSPEGRVGRNQLSIAGKITRESIRLLAEVIHESGTPALLMLTHGGHLSQYEMTGVRPFTPSQFPLREKVLRPGRLPKVMLEEHIERLRAAFVQSAMRAKQGGFDGCMIDAAGGSLLNQFYSPLTNYRTDSYGVGTLENRLRLTCQVIRDVREVVGTDFTLALQFGGYDGEVEGGSTLEELPQALKMLEETGIDMIAMGRGVRLELPRGGDPRMVYRMLAGLYRKNVRIPVLYSGYIRSGEDAEEILEAGDADLIAAGNAIRRDPSWPLENM